MTSLLRPRNRSLPSILIGLVVVSLSSPAAAAPGRRPRPPVIQSVTVAPAHPSTDTTVTAVVDATDPQGYAITLSYQWLRNGVLLSGRSGRTLDLSGTGNGDRGDRISVKVVASNGGARSRPATSAPVDVVNSPPDAAPASGTTSRGQPVTLTLSASDPDGDALNFTASQPSSGSIGTVGPRHCDGDGCAAPVTYTPPAILCNGSDRFSYRASDGQLGSQPATASVAIHTMRTKTVLRLAPPPRIVPYRHRLSLTARLSRFAAGASLTLYRKTPGSAWSAVGRGDPKADGTISFHVRLEQRTSLLVRSSGDNCYLPAASATAAVSVRAKVAGRLMGSQATERGYARYGRSATPHYVAAVLPVHPGGGAVFIWERKDAAGWHPYLRQDATLDAHSRLSVFMTSGVMNGTKYRVRVGWRGGEGNAPAWSRWARFIRV